MQVAFDAVLARMWIAACGLPSSLVRVRCCPGRGAHDFGICHTGPTVVACLAGVVRISFSPREHLDLAVGEVALIPPGVSHEHAPLRPGCLQYGQGFMIGYSDIELAAHDRIWRLAIPEEPARSLIERACTASSAVCEQLVREALTGFESERARSVEPMPPPVERMWSFLRRERLSPITAKDVLRASGLRPTQAHEVFRHYFGRTPYQLIMRQRLDYARHLLSGGEGVAAVASACGFRSSRHFASAFRLVMGESPRAWQRRHGSERTESLSTKKSDLER